MRKSDLFISIVAGAISALVWVPVLKRLGFSLPAESIFWILAFGFIIFLFVAVLFVGEVLSRVWNGVFSSLSKFAIVGFLNTGIDLLVFNSFIAISGIERGNEIVLFKAVSFGTALINSYLWNKFWSFRAGSTGPGRGEFVKYALVTIAGFGINVGTTFALINLIHPPFGLSQLRWDNTAAVIATAANLVWNFIGYRLMVFKAQPAESEVRLQNQHV